MAHNLQSRDIQTGIEQAWHGLTNVVECISRENSGICYEMATVPLVYVSPETGETVETPHRQIISLDDYLPIGRAVSDTYCLIDNSRIWAMVEDSMQGMKHQIVSVGTVDDRSKGFISIKLDEGFTAASRQTDSLLNLLWGHGGSLSLIARSGTTVVVCQNTFNVALGRKGRDLNLTVKHTKNALDRIDNMGKAIEAHYGVMAEFKLAMDSLEAQTCDEEKARKVISGVLAPDTFERELTVSTRTRNQIDRIAYLFNHGAGNRGSNLADVFNAATDYYSHESSGGSDRMKQFVSSEFGAGQRSKEGFFEVLTDSDLLSSTVSRGEKVMLAMN